MQRFYALPAEFFGRTRYETNREPHLSHPPSSFVQGQPHVVVNDSKDEKTASLQLTASDRLRERGKMAKSDELICTKIYSIPDKQCRIR